MFTNDIYDKSGLFIYICNMYINKPDLALNYLLWLICPKIKNKSI